MEKALVEFLNRTKDLNKGLIGSYNLHLQGINISAHDIDFVTDDEGIYKIAERFKAEINNEYGFNACEFELEEQTVNCVSCKGNKLRSCDFMTHVEYLRVEDIEVPCMSLESEAEFYRASGREKDLAKVKLIEGVLNKV